MRKQSWLLWGGVNLVIVCGDNDVLKQNWTRCWPLSVEKEEQRLARGPGHPGARPQEQTPILVMPLFDIVTDQSKVSLSRLLLWHCGAVTSLGGSEGCDGILPLLSVIARAHLFHIRFPPCRSSALLWHGREDFPSSFCSPVSLLGSSQQAQTNTFS